MDGQVLTRNGRKETVAGDNNDARGRFKLKLPAHGSQETFLILCILHFTPFAFHPCVQRPPQPLGVTRMDSTQLLWMLAMLSQVRVALLTLAPSYVSGLEYNSKNTCRDRPT